jgi:hypothetical protein
VLLSLRPKKVTKESLPEIGTRRHGRISPYVHAISAQYQKKVNAEIANRFVFPFRTPADFGRR